MQTNPLILRSFLCMRPCTQTSRIPLGTGHARAGLPQAPTPREPNVVQLRRIEVHMQRDLFCSRTEQFSGPIMYHEIHRLTACQLGSIGVGRTTDQ